jgi:predicted HicB family RNase H-like nuclease
MGQPEHCKTFVLRLPLSAKVEAVAFSKAEGISLNHFISIAVAERLTRLHMKEKEAKHATKPRAF